MKILFLCHSNMCRSPLAEGLLKMIFKDKQINAIVDSAGFEAYYINDAPDDRAVQKARENGIDISTKKVRLFTQEDFDKFDKIYVMDTNSYRNAMYFARDENDIQKLDYLMNVINPGKNESVPDPYYHKLEAGKETYEILKRACEKIASGLESQYLN
ncbi:MAG: low molecular weight phosphotyrosine protein phosphatase [Bacteroidales bacterium]|nr:low molecular weight phosphotyrosine protein phosphatase [Bacteroidales bacterium]